MKIGIITPMEEEKRLILSKMINTKNELIASTKFITGRLFEIDIVLTESGIGKVSAAVATTLLIEKFSVDIVINTGSAGSLNQDLNIGDVVVADKLIYHDADNRIFGYQNGQIPQQPAYFQSDDNLIEKLNKLDLNIKTGLIVSGDSFISGNKREQIKSNFPDSIAVDMESTAVAQVAQNFKKPFLIIRSISDNADGSAEVDFEEFLITAGENSAKLLFKLIENF